MRLPVMELDDYLLCLQQVGLVTVTVCHKQHNMHSSNHNHITFYYI